MGTPINARNSPLTDPVTSPIQTGAERITTPSILSATPTHLRLEMGFISLEDLALLILIRCTYEPMKKTPLPSAGSTI